jgi:hypothetical protein
VVVFYISEENHWVLKPQNAQVWQKRILQMAERDLVEN